VGIALMMRLDAGADYPTELLPAALVFGLGLVMTVAPLTATVLGAVDQRHAGVASGANNAIARVAGLLAIAALGAVVAGRFDTRLSGELSGRTLSPPAQAAVDRARDRPLVVRTTGVPAAERPVVRAALRDASVSSFRLGMGAAAGLVFAGGLISLIGIQNPRRRVPAGDCPGGSLAGASRHSVPEPAHVPARGAVAEA
jgi:hypothetical protein